MPIITEANYQQIARAAIGQPSFEDDNVYIELVKTTAKQLDKLVAKRLCLNVKTYSKS
jgi:hypothetical protein